ncbi:alkaline phosphatase-like protein [Xylariales sp. PMI_506]|nr:alkaline phosphatase-like protein [Xylariales sp. PMI_506]
MGGPNAVGLITTVAFMALKVVASFDGNINYQSPSRRHDTLGINVPHVARRSMKRGSVAYTPDQLNFTHGVASGDPLEDSVILWTRIAPTMASDNSNITVEGTAPLYNTDRETYIKADKNPICVNWEVSTVDSTDVVVSKGTAYTTSDIDYTIKVEATGLEAFTEYTYKFAVCGSNNTSPIGRTKTSPAADDDTSEISFAVFSCANFPLGYFNVYGNAARKNEHDYVIHLGDYIYESHGEGERASDPQKYCFSLPDYRTRHNQYRTDLDLQLLSQNYAWLPTWDDHEVANNVYRDGMSALLNTENSFLSNGQGIAVDQRKVNAVRAYFEWMPIRHVDLDDNLRIWRSFQMGNLLDLIVLDTRNYDRSITDLGSTFTEYIDTTKDEAGRTLMGSRQEKWFYRSLSDSANRGATWRIVANQVIFSRLATPTDGFLDSWNGYAANRNRTLKHLYDNNIGNNIFLAGDSHENWVSDLVWRGEKPYDSTTGNGSVGAEFAGTAVTNAGAGGYGSIATIQNQSKDNVDLSPELQWQEGYYRGYFLLSVSQKQVTARYYGSPTVASRNGWDLPLANFTVEAGANHLSRPIAGGKVEAGTVRGGVTDATNLTLDTDTGEWAFIGFDTMYLDFS